VSYSFTMGDWRWDQHIDTDEGSAYLWIVPANVDGAWKFRPETGNENFEVSLEQTFQTLKGFASDALVTGKLSGPNVDFAFTQGGKPTHVTGTVDGDGISATVTRDGRATAYVGSRKSPRSR